LISVHLQSALLTPPIRESALRRLAGHILGAGGLLSAIALTVGTSWEWNIGGRGRPLQILSSSLFELMIIVGGVSILIGFFLQSRLQGFD
jgi:hypothetical protein